jgi:hypothetical protein
MAGLISVMAGFNNMLCPEGTVFYIQKIGQGKVLEIRTKLEMDHGNQYRLDRKRGDYAYVTKEEFYYIPEGYRMIRVL